MSVGLSRKLEDIFVSFWPPRPPLLLLSLVLLSLPADLPAASLTVAAAADMAAAERTLTQAFHQTYPADTVRFVFSASGALAQQIANGAPYDVFLSANEGFVDQLSATQKIVPDSVEVYAIGQLGILWRDGKSHKIEELANKWVRLVAVANPKLAPYGVAAQQSLEHQSLWDTIRSKMVFGENVRQTLQMFDSGNADAVLTAYALIADRPAAAVIPNEWHNPIRQKAGIVAGSQNLEAAGHFLAFLVSPAGIVVLRQHGFTAPK
jgi:molybdate transport system substrate-binding protein